MEPPIGWGPRSLTALMHREKPLEAKLKTKILLSMTASQVLILTLLCGSFKLFLEASCVSQVHY